MSPLMLGITTVVSLLIVTSLALAIRGYVRNAHHGVQWPLRKEKRVQTTITDVQIKQDWKEGERWERSLWDGRFVRQRTWQTYYDVTAQWVHVQTKQRYIFGCKIWSDEVAKTPTAGDTIVFIVNLRHPEQYAVDVQSLS